MAQQKIVLGAVNRNTGEPNDDGAVERGWRFTTNRTKIDTDLVKDGGTAYFAELNLRNTFNGLLKSVEFKLAANASTGGGGSSGPDLSATYETSGALALVVGSTILHVPTAAVTTDPDEPYRYTTADGVDGTAFDTMWTLLGTGTPSGTLYISDAGTPTIDAVAAAGISVRLGSQVYTKAFLGSVEYTQTFLGSQEFK